MWHPVRKKVTISFRAECTYVCVTVCVKAHPCNMCELQHRPSDVGQSVCFTAASSYIMYDLLWPVCVCVMYVPSVCVCVCVCVNAHGHPSVCKWHWPWNYYLYAVGQGKGGGCQVGFPFVSSEVSDCRPCLRPASVSTHTFALRVCVLCDTICAAADSCDLVLFLFQGGLTEV